MNKIPKHVTSTLIKRDNGDIVKITPSIYLSFTRYEYEWSFLVEICKKGCRKFNIDKNAATQEDMRNAAHIILEAIKPLE